MTITLDLHRQLTEEFGQDIAMAAVLIHSLHLRMKLKEKDLTDGGNFNRRLKKKTDDLLWAIPADIRDRAFVISKLIHNWEIGRALDGLGGCEAKSFKQLLGEE